jgi:hypothetical protein
VIISKGALPEFPSSRSRLNALRTGITRNPSSSPGEDPAAVEQIRAEYNEHRQPITHDERDVLDSIVHAACMMPIPNPRRPREPLNRGPNREIGFEL